MLAFGWNRFFTPLMSGAKKRFLSRESGNPDRANARSFGFLRRGAVGGWLKAKGKRLWAVLFFYDVAHSRDLDSRFRGRGSGFGFAT